MNRKDMAGISTIQGAVVALIAATVDANYAACDLLHHDGCRINFMVGNSGDTLSGSVFLELEVEESDDNSTWSDVPDGSLTTEVAGTNDGCFALIDAPAEDSQIFQTEYLGSKRYIRGVLNVTGTHTNGTPIAMWYDRCRPSGG